MKIVNWNEYKKSIYRQYPIYPQVNNEYIYTYPVNYGDISTAEIISTDDVKRYWPTSYSIYVHFPFCKELCPFCTFCHQKWEANIANKYIECIKKEIEAYSCYYNEKISINSIYFGGGTPCLIPPDSVRSIIDIIKKCFKVNKNAEITIEANPADADKADMSSLLESGINRISFGIQAFDKKNTRTLRIRPRDTCGYKAINSAFKLGYENISIDLLYGIPGQTHNEFIDNINIGLDLGATGISLYWLDMSGSKLEKYLASIMDSNIAKDQYYRGRIFLMQNKFKQQTQPDYYKNNKCVFVSNSWRAPQGGGIGFGVGAITFYYKGYTYVNTHDISEYINYIEHGMLPIIGGVRVNKSHLMAKYMILGFRCLKISKKQFELIFDVCLPNKYGRIFDELIKMGLIFENKNDYRVSEKGLWYIDNISRRFFDKYNMRYGQPWSHYLENIRKNNHIKI